MNFPLYVSHKWARASKIVGITPHWSSTRRISKATVHTEHGDFEIDEDGPLSSLEIGSYLAHSENSRFYVIPGEMFERDYLPSKDERQVTAEAA